MIPEKLAKRKHQECTYSELYITNSLATPHPTCASSQAHRSGSPSYFCCCIVQEHRLWNTFTLLKRANSRKTWEPTAPTYINEYDPQESWPLDCKQPPASPFDEHAVWSYKQPTNWDIPPAGTFNSWPLPIVITKISLSFIARGRSQLCLVRTPDVITAMPGQHVFQHMRQISLKYLSYHLQYLISAFFHTHSTIFCERTLSPQYDLICNTDIHTKHEGRLRNFLVRQFVCRWQWIGGERKKLPYITLWIPPIFIDS